MALVPRTETTPLKILYLDEDQSAHQIAEFCIQEGVNNKCTESTYFLKSATSIADACEAIREFNFDIVVYHQKFCEKEISSISYDTKSVAIFDPRECSKECNHYCKCCEDSAMSVFDFYAGIFKKNLELSVVGVNTRAVQH